MQFLENLPFNLDLLPKPVYVVGGAVRDALLGRVRAELDLDLVVPTGAVDLARKLATEYRAGFVLLDPERQIARVVFPGMTVDIAQQDGESINNDLARRDYTLNAIAYDIQTRMTVDPFCGTQDIHQRTIRMLSRDNLIDDPLRLLRAYRQGAQLNFAIEVQTRQAIRELVPLLTNVAAERVLAELRYLLLTSNSSQWLAAMVADELLIGWLELPIGADFAAKLSQFDRACELVRQHYPALDRELDRPLRDTIAISRRAIGRFMLLLSSDLQIATTQMLRLTFSSAEIQVASTVITYLPQLLSKPMSLTEQYFWFQAVDNNFPLSIVLAIAAGVELLSLAPLIDRYLDPQDLVAHPTPLVNGRELVEFLKIPPSPTIGKLLTEIQLARINGEISTPSEALEFARELLRVMN
ncbi:CCA tRNA nucleotidyltransferase [Chamaesiphon minutus]|uniref:tRNA nucleotidyltransferase/poly(A) polymerase n=1 Tax=Chamaesiphon minutus (strain ATCC 27169 / PCC 6605) TaxID=1173020 RepID=K9UMN9_CHAP6|nr:CCA tRNA nucleotidyltransferase [Chamaesiphon minutus]AFY95923.1 tRNA nucleotidyltransferase/poly(A) polymerase [Chamaesiphon minutus PCC 6605]